MSRLFWFGAFVTLLSTVVFAIGENSTALLNANYVDQLEAELKFILAVAFAVGFLGWGLAGYLAMKVSNLEENLEELEQRMERAENGRQH